MWRRSDERRLVRAFAASGEAPTPEGLRDRVQADIEARFAAPARAPSRSRRLLGAAGAAVIAGCLAAALTIGRSPDLLAQAVDAMAQTRTAHIRFRLQEPNPWVPEEMWVSVEHGLRYEWQGRVAVLTPEVSWRYDTEANTLTVEDPEPSFEDASEFLRSFWGGAEWLEEMRETASAYDVSDDQVDGVPAKRVEFTCELGDAGEHRAAIWLERGTMRPLEFRVWRADEPDDAVLVCDHSLRYDVDIGPDLFAPIPPPGCTLVDNRLDGPVGELIDAAIEALRTLPVHELGEEAAGSGDGAESSCHMWSKWDAWWRNGIGYRIEYEDGSARGATPRVEWRHSGQGIRIEPHDEGAAATRPVILDRLESVQRPQHFRPHVSRQQKSGRQIASVILFPVSTLSGPGGEQMLASEGKLVFRFDVEDGRLVTCESYLPEGGTPVIPAWPLETGADDHDGWRLAEKRQFEYLDELPEGTFEPSPPPGANIDDLRGR